MLEGNMIPKAIEVSPRRTPEPLVLKPKRRVRQYVPESGLAQQGEEHSLPDYGHREMLGPPKHFEPSDSRKGFVGLPQDNIMVGSFVPLCAPDYHSLTARAPSPRRSTNEAIASESPSRSNIAGYPLRHSSHKNRSSSPNILAWD
jgi:hypothetical protein